MPLDEPNLSTLTREIVPFNKIVDKLPKPGDRKPKIVSVDIMGIIILAGNPKDVNSPFGPSTVQHFTFVDMDKKPIPVSLWDEMVHVVGPIHEEAAATYSVVLAKRLEASHCPRETYLHSLSIHLSRLLLCLNLGLILCERWNCPIGSVTTPLHSLGTWLIECLWMSTMCNTSLLPKSVGITGHAPPCRFPWMTKDYSISAATIVSRRSIPPKA